VAGGTGCREAPEGHEAFPPTSPHSPASSPRATARTRTRRRRSTAHSGDGVLGGFPPVGGKDLSWNNLLGCRCGAQDGGAVRGAGVGDRQDNNPSGWAGGRPGDRLRPGARHDPVSAFGGILAVNRPVDLPLASPGRSLPGGAPGAGVHREALAPSPARRPCASSSARLPAGGHARSPAMGCARWTAASLAQAPDALADAPAPWTCPPGAPRRPRSGGA